MPDSVSPSRSDEMRLAVALQATASRQRRLNIQPSLTQRDFLRRDPWPEGPRLNQLIANATAFGAYRP